MTNWADEFPLVSPPPDNPVRGDASGMGDEFLVKLKPANTPGAATQFLSRTGVWVNFASTELNAWGSIIGDINNQQDLIDALALKADVSGIALVGFTGRYGDLLDKPPLGDVSTINTNGLTSQFLRGDGQWAIPVDVNAQWGNIAGDINAQTDLIAALNLKANSANPVFTGNPRAPTPAADNSSDSVATTAWFFGQAFDGNPVMAGVAASGDSTRWARGNHRHPVDTTRAPLSSPNFIDIPTAPTPAVGNVSQRLATTEFVKNAIDAAGLTPPPSDGNTYGFKDGVWVVLDLGTKWDKA